jgi:hypothetical protein
MAEENSATGPPTSRVDLKIYKNFNLAGIKIKIFAEILNLLNNRNIVKYFGLNWGAKRYDYGTKNVTPYRYGGAIYYGLNPATGKPYKYGDYDIRSKRIYSYHEILYLNDPRIYDEERQIYIGIQIEV